MRTALDPEELAGAAQVLSGAAQSVGEARDVVDAGGTAWLVTRASAASLPDAILGEHDPWSRLRLAADLQEELGSFVVTATLEERRLSALATGLRAMAALWVEVEAAVTRGLRRLDQVVHDHPGQLERVAELGHRWALGGILGAGERHDLLTEGPEDLAGLTSSPPRAGVAPSSLVDLIAGDVEVEQTAGLVRVNEVVRADGTSAWVVQISGTQAWWPRAGGNPFDVTTDVRAVAGEATVAAAGVHLALLQAQRSTGRDTSAEPVLVTGHSLGGILAATVAADRTFRQGRNVVGVVTAGSPIARVPVPASVSVVALEHVGDPVPRLDGRPNPPRPNWSTVPITPDSARTLGQGTRSHDGRLYVDSAQRVVSAAAESLPEEPWEEVIAPFVRGADRTVVVHDFTVTREWQNPRS